jgi:hypothetical protein
MAAVIPIRLVVDLGGGQRRGEAPAPHHLDAERDRIGEQLFIERRGEIGRVQDPQPIGFGDAEEELETGDLVAAFPGVKPNCAATRLPGKDWMRVFSSRGTPL